MTEGVKVLSLFQLCCIVINDSIKDVKIVKNILGGSVFERYKNTNKEYITEVTTEVVVTERCVKKRKLCGTHQLVAIRSEERKTIIPENHVREFTRKLFYMI